MNLKKFKLTNFRKFKNDNNEVNFVLAKNYGEKNVNIAPVTTLIIGQNNGGKTTIIEALKRVINGIALKAEDFNFDYLNEFLIDYKEYIDNSNKEKKILAPIIEFELTIEISTESDDLLTNIIPILTIGDLDCNDLNIKIKWEVKDEEIFFQKVKELFEKNYDEDRMFSKFLETINEIDFKYTYYNLNEDILENNILKNLINIESISANNVTSEDCLSKSFSKIVDYRYNNLTEADKKIYDIDNKIEEINRDLTSYLKNNYTESINDSLKFMFSSKKCQVLLKADMNFQNLIRNIVKYEYVEKDKFIPENQFGLGYTNLMMIVADIITYIDKYPSDKFNSQINLIAIEEPETYMHPQMQELFIRHINKMVSSLLSNRHKNVNSQIIITTHSAHILNSKIHEGKSFNNINYVTTEDNNAKCIALNDDVIKGNNDDTNFQFLKKHIKFGVSEMFFSDAVIFVEGITEYVLLRNYLMGNNDFNKYYISIFLINGAYAHIYDNLIKILNVPTLIITDIDFKRKKFEKNENDENHKEKYYLQMTEEELKSRRSTNNCINNYYKNKTVKEIIEGDYYKEGNLMVTCQKNKIQGYYATSFEEALILTNYNNDTLKKAISKISKSLEEIVNSDEMIKKSYELQKRLSSSKSNFANTILYECIVNENNGIQLPMYIDDGLKFIKDKLDKELGDEVK
ncbi:ATP-dependent nuclease [Faecalibacillus intestinalis]|uniref:ATP-dependent nuclease n=1 Tax=Faecalibacillus intestinalis TaxID=1982626 RepID=UPI003521E7AA